MERLSDIACFVEDKVRSSNIDLSAYITTDCILPNKQGRTIAQNLPPQECSLTKYTKGDVLIANIRPYLKKIWYADCEGGCSNDVLVLRALPNHSSAFLFAALSNDKFFDYVMMGTKGSKMPRGDKDQVMRYKIPMLTYNKEECIGRMVLSIERKIKANQEINHNLEAMAKQLYDYWFVQFDFPNADGKPYKSSGGKMVWNAKLKRYIPEGWECKPISEIADIKNGATPSTTDENNYGGDIVWITPKDLSDQQCKFTDHGQRNITKDGYDSCSTSLLPIGSILMSSRAPIGLLSIAKTNLCTNQGFKNIVPNDIQDSNYLYYYIQWHIPQIQQLGTGTTFKEVSKDDLSSFPILVVKSTNVYKQWNGISTRIFDEQYKLTQKTNLLTKLRDELLPLLMNGQVSVNYDLAHD